MKYRGHVLIALFLTILFTVSSFAEPRSGQTVRIAAFSLYPAIFKTQDNSIQGFYVDFIAEIARREGWNVEYVYGNWSDGLARIRNGEVDVLTSVTWTEERQAYMDYGKAPLNTVWSELYVPEKSSIDNIRQVQGKKIAVMKGDSNGANFRNLVEKFGIPCQIAEYGNFEEIFAAISTNQVDGGVVNNTYGAAKQRDYNVKSSGVIFNPFDIYFTVAKGKNQKVLATLDRYLTEWRANENSPYHLARQRWAHGNIGTVNVIPQWVTNSLIGLGIAAVIAAAFIILLRTQVRIQTSRVIAQNKEREKIEEALYFINECGSRHQGEDLLVALTAHVATCLGAEYAFVSRLLPDGKRVRTLGLYAMGSKADNIEYDLPGTPCDNVVGQKLCYYPDNVRNIFPEDRLLVDMEAVGYAACPLWDSHGVGIGLLGVVSKRRLEDQALVETIIQIVGARAAQELEAMSNLKELMLKNFTIENIADAVFWIYADGRIWNVNETACQALGYTKQELLAKSVMDIVPDCSPEGWSDLWRKLKKAKNLRTESTHRDKHGRVFPVEVNGNYFSYDDIEYCCSIVHDISERKESEIEKQTLLAQLSQSQRLESIGRLAGGIAHDFNNLLTPILGYAELLKSTLQADNTAINKIDNIITAADRAKILTQQLLSFCRKQILEMKTIDLNRVITTFYEILRRTIREDIEINVRLCDEAASIRGDRNQIEQIIMNLVINAQDAIKDKGLITIETAAVILDDEYAGLHDGVQAGRYLMLVVSDTGCGMDEETIAHIYEPFFTTKGVGEGTGLGLATVYGIVKQHKGHIEAFCEIGGGCVFKLYFPMVDEAPAEAVESMPESTVPNPQGRTILLVEDNVMVKDLVYEFLVENGFNVIVTEGPKQAVTASEDQYIDLLVTDVIMPGMNGAELYRQLQKTHQNLRVLFMSGYSNNVIAHHGVLDEGINFIQKPFSLPAMVAKVHEALFERS